MQNQLNKEAPATNWRTPMKTRHSWATVLAFVAFAVSPSALNAATIYACRFNTLGTIRIVSATTICTHYETKIFWEVQGPPGPQGAQGPQGPQGLQGAQGPQGHPQDRRGHKDRWDQRDPEA